MSDGDSAVHSAGRALVREDYVRAERFLPWNAEKLVFGLTVQPHWIEDTDVFWYCETTRDGSRFILVDPEAGTRAPAFDHERLAAALSETSGTPCAPAKLPFNDIEFAEDKQAIHFDYEGDRWSCDLTSYACARGEKSDEPAGDVVRSPDGAWDAFTRDHNLWVRSVATGEERQLTEDGEAGYAYGMALPSPLAGAGLAAPEGPAVIWSPDSQRLVSCRIDERKVLRLHLVQSVPKDGSIRPKLHSYAYPLPGDDDAEMPRAEIVVVDVNSAAVTRADIDPLPMLYYGSPLNPKWVWWSADSQSVYLVRRERGFQGYRLITIDGRSGAARTVVEEQGKQGIDPYLHWNSPNVRVAAGGSEVIWYSQRDGWGHLYLYDAGSGDLLRQLTSGPYDVAEVQHVDDGARWIYFTAGGRESGRDPYYVHLYRVSFDGGDPELLTPEDADHSVAFAPSGRYFIDSHSTVATPPVATLRASDGAEICALETADIEPLLATGWRLPERFSVKARDGVTDIYGVIFHPSKFDPEQQYPVIDSIYAGPQVNQAPASFADSARGRESGFWQAQALAELGFVVVMIDGLGMPGRSKAYHDVSYRNLGDGGIEDHIAALRQLADRYPYLDLSRVGIYGHSAGGYASAHAILSYPDFYKVCVSSAGNHDHRLDKASWVERYMGLPVGAHYREQANQTLASNLQGKLLLIHGDMDENVHVSSTLVVVDALIEANKDFDLLIMPNRPHACGNDPYFIRRRWDYFVRHLGGTEPPKGYRIAPDPRT